MEWLTTGYELVANLYRQSLDAFCFHIFNLPRNYGLSNEWY